MAEYVSAVAVFECGGLCAGGPAAAEGGGGDGARDGEVDLLLVPSLRDELLVIFELYGASVADAARGVCGGERGAERLGSGPEASAAEVRSAAAGAAWRDAGGAAV